MATSVPRRKDSDASSFSAAAATTMDAVLNIELQPALQGAGPTAGAPPTAATSPSLIRIAFPARPPGPVPIHPRHQIGGLVLGFNLPKVLLYPSALLADIGTSAAVPNPWAPLEPLEPTAEETAETSVTAGARARALAKKKLASSTSGGGAGAGGGDGSEPKRPSSRNRSQSRTSAGPTRRDR
eukprot:c28197_g1_i1.p1 GENE.c28197_g1_i1~~c28197_g1_i1.p1  ORF type:complete len:183 (+),score=8.25 c28197_g1_i1:113-661(+)